MHDNYDSVLHQMRAFGIELVDRDFPLQIPSPKRITCGKKGKCWYWLQEFRPEDRDGHPTGEVLIVGRFGTYKHGGSDEKVDIERRTVTPADRERMQREQREAAERSRQKKQEAAAEAALSAAELWKRAAKEGQSAYLERKGVIAEACRYLRDGSIVIPLLRYDLPKGQALVALQRIYPGPRWDSSTGEELPQKSFTKGFAKTGAALRLGMIDESTWLVLVCEGYATALSIRMATDRQLPVYVALDAYNLGAVVEILRRMHPHAWLLICADDDWKSEDHHGPNPGRRAARDAARKTEACDIVWPIFNPRTREPKDTDFNDLHLREGLATVSKQLDSVMTAMQWRPHGR